jgi:hypothetical protein
MRRAGSRLVLWAILLGVCARASAAGAQSADTEQPLSTHAEGADGSGRAGEVAVVHPEVTPVTARTHPDWGIFTTGALTVGVSYTIAMIFGVIGDTYGYSGILAIPLGGGVAYASLWDQGIEARWRGALLSASQLIGLVTWIVGMVISIPDRPPPSTRLVAGPGDLGLSVSSSF